MGRIVDLLLKKGANPNITDAANHRTPLHRAIVAGNRPAFDALMAQHAVVGVDLDARDDQNRVPLSLALDVARRTRAGPEEEIGKDSFAAILADNGASAQIIQVLLCLA